MERTRRDPEFQKKSSSAMADDERCVDSPSPKLFASICGMGGTCEASLLVYICLSPAKIEPSCGHIHRTSALLLKMAGVDYVTTGERTIVKK